MEIVDRHNAHFDRRLRRGSGVCEPAMASAGRGASGGKEREGERGQPRVETDHHDLA